jgi:hypothetical protein
VDEADRSLSWGGQFSPSNTVINIRIDFNNDRTMTYFHKIFVKRRITSVSSDCKGQSVYQNQTVNHVTLCALFTTLLPEPVVLIFVTLQKFSVGECWPSGYLLQIKPSTRARGTGLPVDLLVSMQYVIMASPI